MNTIALIYLILLLTISLLLSNKNILAPSVLTCAIWLTCLVLFCVLPHQLPPLSGQFWSAFFIWTTLLCLSSLFVQSFNHIAPQTKANKPIRNIFLAITFITFPLYLTQVIPILMYSGEHWAWALRQYALNENTFSGFIVLIWRTTYVIELYYTQKSNLWRTIVPALICLVFGIFSMAKITFLEFTITTFVILYTKKLIKFRHIVIGLLLLIATFFAIQSIRHEQTFNKNIEKTNFIVLYALSSMTAFDTIEPYSTEYVGENTFRIYYAVTHAFGGKNKPIDPILPFIQKPIVTNTYTAMYPFFKDFGYIGIAIAAIFMGIIFGYFFRGVQQKSAFFIIAYAYFANVIVLQYVADTFMTNLAGHIKFLILLSTPFVIEHFKFLKIHTHAR